MSDSTEQLIAATGANKAPRVTPADIEAAKMEREFQKAALPVEDLGDTSKPRED